MMYGESTNISKREKQIEIEYKVRAWACACARVQ